MSAFLELRRVNAFYEKSHILFDVDIRLEEGRSVCLLGRNGVGKSTTMRSIMGLMNPLNKAKAEGSIKLQGKELIKLPPYAIAQLGIAYVPQGRHIFTNLSTKENLLIAQKKGVNEKSDWDIERIYELFPRLKERENSPGGKLSGGEQQMLAVARGLMQNPRLLLLDEITEGLAPIIVQQLKEIVQELIRRKVSILVAEQSVKFALSVAEDCYIMEKGAVVHHEKCADISDATINRYLGT